MNNIPHLLGYEILEQIYVGSRSLIYRGVRDSDNYPVVIKLLRNPLPQFKELVNFRNQYKIAQNIDLPNIVKMLALEPYKNVYAIVMEDFGGISLRELLKRESPFVNTSRMLNGFLKTAIQITEALDGLYKYQIIHKNIKPDNILINPDTKQVKLIDFSSASLLINEKQEIQSTHNREETLPYISPEQTGRMNRFIDYRSDFYSLGVTLYELLTGELPFVSDDPMELVHCHLAKSPIPAYQRNPEVPQIISNIVDKLMAKNAEERYQNALGIKNDLEKCLREGTNKLFELGQQDNIDRFLIPNKLYGREMEVTNILSAFERVSNGNTEMMLVAGFSGIGKTAVINEVQKPIIRQRGYFIKGKYDQLQGDIPFFGFVQAFRDLIGQLLAESDAQMQAWKKQILGVLGENGQVLIEVIPELEYIIGTQPPVLELSGNAAQNRFNRLIQSFVEIFTIANHPLVIFLDDLQWADAASLKLLKLLMQDKGHLLVLGAYRDNEVAAAHPMVLAVEEIAKSGATVNVITLNPLREKDINQLVADTMLCDLVQAQLLTECIYPRTQGNPFFTSQFLKTLYEDGLITFDWEARHWQWDFVQIAFIYSDNVVELMVRKLQKLPIETQELIKLGACIGNQFDLNTLAIVSERSPLETATILWSALKDGLILPLDQNYKFFQSESGFSSEQDLELWQQNSQSCTYSFLHDRVQQAAYSLIPDSQKESVHLRVGWLLLDHIPIDERELHIFTIVNHLNRGANLIHDSREREQMVHLNLLAAEKAKRSSAYAVAINYLDFGLQFLSSQCWQEQYSLSLEIYQLAAEVNYLCGDYAQMSNLIEIGLQNVQNHLDCAKFYETQILALTAQNHYQDAVKYARKVLLKFGVALPNNLFGLRTIVGFLITVYRMSVRTHKDLLTLPAMTNSHKLVICNLFNVIGAAAQTSMPEILPFITFIGISLYLRYGNIPKSSMAYTIYAYLLCEKLGRIDAGYAMGKVAIALCHQNSSKIAIGSTLFIWSRFIAYRKESLSDNLPILLEAYQMSLEVGDVEYAAYNLCVYFFQSYLAGKNLVDLQRAAIANRPVFKKLQHRLMANLHDLNCQCIDNLTTTNNSDICELVGRFFDATTISEEDRPLQIYTSFTKLFLSFLFHRYPFAMEQIAIIETGMDVINGTFAQYVFYFYDALIRLAQYNDLTTREKKACLSKVKKDCKHLSILAKSAPMNFKHKLLLVEAERLRVLKKSSQASEFYDRVIAEAKANGFIQDEAIANELAARFYLARGNEKMGQVYMMEAYYCYGRWGATAKVADLEKLYSQFLIPIPQKKTSPFSKPLASNFSISGSESLDLATLLKASQAISGEIELSKLLETLLTIIIANAGADKCILLLQVEKELQIAARIESGQQPQVFSPPISPELSQDMAMSVLNKVKRSLYPAVLVNAQKSQWANDLYIQQNQSKSILCSPILQQGKLLGILYLENNLTVGAFTRDRLEVLNFLCSQAAISIQNAQLYAYLETANSKLADYSQTLEQKVEQRTADLKAAQQQIIAQEKLASLGTLTAGIAHELRNPLNFVLNYARSSIELNQELLEIIQPLLPALDADTSDLIQELIADLQENDITILAHSQRAENIIESMMQHTRTDGGQVNFQPTQINALLEKSLKLVYHSKKTKDSGFNMTIQTAYDTGLDLVDVVTVSMSRAFINIIDNACDAMRFCQNQLKTDPDQVAKYQPTLHLSTNDLGDRVEIRIRDNGCGIAPELQSKVLDPFFTTKPAGEGTGLGLSLTHDIIVKQHKGNLTINTNVLNSDRFTEIIIAIPYRHS
ncbi:ATP-binding sensor histidine kinase [Pseudanabaena sp. ABRG5-3]|uniref:trifunctional serine/threonine-protein kinase/ATP-binding protein/sensor histidine kinase n=1 Tax=Pseudanabaena sp. ABRG5-3 TaxID=685565 RepID=UPI000DC72ABC|nr:ATP-binding sensor histidine kinase [Pseudanabaena sp. ABRG5-3]BBC23453.1 multi-sensor signal transduction multi-kinase [Pseudanabaena sp. ABRG5-3]